MGLCHCEKTGIVPEEDVCIDFFAELICRSVKKRSSSRGQRRESYQKCTAHADWRTDLHRMRKVPGKSIAAKLPDMKKMWHICGHYVDGSRQTVSCHRKFTCSRGCPKGDKMELIIQKAVELGVYEIIPVATKRAVVKLDAEKGGKRSRNAGRALQKAQPKQSRTKYHSAYPRGCEISVRLWIMQKIWISR